MSDQPNTQDFAVSDPNGSSLLGAIALGFAAGYGGPSVQQMQAQMRQNSWQSWQQAQELKVRREEMAAANRRFEASLDLQRRDLEQREAQSKRAEGGLTARTLMAQFGDTFRTNLGIKASKDAEARAVQRKQGEDLAADLDRGMALGQLRPVGPAEFDLNRDELAAGRADKVRQDERDFAAQQANAARADRKEASAEDRKVQVAQLRASIEGKKAEFSAETKRSAAAAALATQEKQGGDFGGHVNEWLKVFGYAEGIAAFDGTVKQVLDDFNNGEATADEVKAAVAPVLSQSDSRPTSRPTGGLPAIGAESRPTGGTIPPIGKQKLTEKRSAKAASEVAAARTKIDTEREGYVRQFIDEIPSDVVAAIEARLGDSADEDAVVREILRNWKEGDRRANRSRTRSVAGPSTIVTEAAKAAAGR